MSRPAQLAGSGQRDLHTARAQDDDLKEMMDMLHQTCVEKISINEDLINRANKGDFVDDPNLKCYMKCIFVETSSMTEDGAFDADATIAMMPDKIKGEASKAINSCKGESGADACEIAFNIHKCLYKANPQLYFLI
ncbi:general odorant-binding protein 83a isoform X2 [Anabrus simplex]|uniref:general odorant-binding protein 83a isoform X2 n=1 Tax=Anabrus simplex TaxID=316456 RepID=UPI0034DD396F